MNFLRGTYRFAGFILLTFVCVMKIVTKDLISGRNLQRAIGYRRNLAKQLLRLLNVEVEFSGNLPPKGFLGVANHRTYMDSIAIFQYMNAVPVVKASVRKWPLIGGGLKMSGTVFVDRKSKESRTATRNQISGMLAEVISMVVFVEGTTHRGPGTLEFRPGTFKTAAEGDFDLVPIAIEYEDLEMAWTGKQLFIPHFYKCFGQDRTIRCKVAFGPVMRDTDEEELRKAAQSWVDYKVKAFRREYDASEEALKVVRGSMEQPSMRRA